MQLETGGPAAHATERPRRGVVLLAAIAIALDIVGGLVPAVDHQVRIGVLPEVLDPERYIGPPSIGSVSGQLAAMGACVWAAIALAGLLCASLDRSAAIVLLALAGSITALINVFLPLQLQNVGGSELGVLQTIAIILALVSLVRPSDPRPRS